MSEMPSHYGLPRESTSLSYLVDPSSQQSRCEECGGIATSPVLYADHGLCAWCAEEKGLVEEPVTPATRDAQVDDCGCVHCRPGGHSHGCSSYRGTAEIEYRRAVMGS